MIVWPIKPEPPHPKPLAAQGCRGPSGSRPPWGPTVVATGPTTGARSHRARGRVRSAGACAGALRHGGFPAVRCVDVAVGTDHGKPHCRRTRREGDAARRLHAGTGSEPRNASAGSGEIGGAGLGPGIQKPMLALASLGPQRFSAQCPMLFFSKNRRMGYSPTSRVVMRFNTLSQFVLRWSWQSSGLTSPPAD